MPSREAQAAAALALGLAAVRCSRTTAFCPPSGHTADPVARPLGARLRRCDRLPARGLWPPRRSSVAGVWRPRATRSSASSAAASEGQPEYSSQAQTSLNLMKSMMGSGALALPAAVATVSASTKILVPAFSVSVLFALMSAYCFVLIARLCNTTGSRSYESTWSETMSPSTSWIPGLAVLIKTHTACISYLMIIGDCFSRVLAPLGLPHFVSGRNPIIVIATSTILLFLCNLKSLAALARVSIAGTAAALFTLFVVASRCLDGSYAAGGALLSAAPLAPRFDTFSGHPFATLLTPTSTKLFCTFAYAFTIHYSAPQFWSQLRPGKDKVKTMTAAALTAFMGASMFGNLLILFGFLTFGGACQGNLLNNYAVSDALALPARAALGLSIINNFPIIFLNFRDSTLRMLGSAAQELDRSKRTLVTVLLLLSVAPWAIVLQDLGRLAAVTGAVLSSFLLYTAPALMALNASRRGIFRLPRRQAMIERAFWILMVPIGLSLAVVGCANSLR